MSFLSKCVNSSLLFLKSSSCFFLSSYHVMFLIIRYEADKSGSIVDISLLYSSSNVQVVHLVDK